MPICWDCGISLSPNNQPPTETRFHKVVGWQGKCDECEKIKFVFSRADFRVNPKLYDLPIKHRSPT